MRNQGKNYETPERAWQSDRIDEEKRLRETYGLANKKEVWKAQSMVRTFRRQVRKLNAEEDETQQEQLLTKMKSLNVLDNDANLNDVLDLDVEDILERRLQTIVYRRGLADTPREARQLITHGHIMVDGKRVDVPSYLVHEDEENEIRVSPGSKHIVSND